MQLCKNQLTLGMFYMYVNLNARELLFCLPDFCQSIRPPIHSSIRPSVRPLVSLSLTRPLKLSLTRSLTHSPKLSLTHSLTQALTHLPTHSLIRTLTHSRTHSPNLSLTQLTTSIYKSLQLLLPYACTNLTALLDCGDCFVDCFAD